jgi:hypothetical protein
MFIVLSMLAGTLYAAEIPSYKRYVIQLPDVRHLSNMLRDLDGDGMTDLLTFSPFGEVFIFIQTPSGFPATPDQHFKLDEGTVWWAVADVSTDPDEEIVISTANGVAYYSQKDGVFATEPKTLIEAEQLFAGKTVSHVGFVGGYRAASEGKLADGIPVIFPDHVVTYAPDDRRQYQPGERTDLEYKTRMWGAGWSGLSVGAEESRFLTVTRRAQYKSEKDETDGEAEDHPYIKQAVEKLKEKRRHSHFAEEVDINGDGRKDVAFWYYPWNIDPKTTLMTFIRRADGSLPEKPDQVLRCRGLAANWGMGRNPPSAFADIDNDGYQDIVLLELKELPRSFSSVIELLTDEGIDWRFAVRLFDPEKGYSRRADHRKNITAILPFMRQMQSMINLGGDFNGDGRPDLMIRRKPSLIEVYFSSKKGELFGRKPALRFEVPKKGWPLVHDYNGDNLSDIMIDSATDFTSDDEEQTITLFLSEDSAGGGAAR